MSDTIDYSARESGQPGTSRAMEPEEARRVRGADHTYEVVDRGANVPAGKRFTLRVDGAESLRYGPTAHSMNRIAARLRQGVYNPAAVLQRGSENSQLEVLNAGIEPQRKDETREDYAVRKFMTSGRLNEKYVPPIRKEA